MFRGTPGLEAAVPATAGTAAVGAGAEGGGMARPGALTLPPATLQPSASSDVETMAAAATGSSHGTETVGQSVVNAAGAVGAGVVGAASWLAPESSTVSTVPAASAAPATGSSISAVARHSAVMPHQRGGPDAAAGGDVSFDRRDDRTVMRPATSAMPSVAGNATGSGAGAQRTRVGSAAAENMRLTAAGAEEAAGTPASPRSRAAMRRRASAPVIPSTPRLLRQSSVTSPATAGGVSDARDARPSMPGPQPQVQYHVADNPEEEAAREAATAAATAVAAEAVERMEEEEKASATLAGHDEDASAHDVADTRRRRCAGRGENAEGEGKTPGGVNVASSYGQNEDLLVPPWVAASPPQSVSFSVMLDPGGGGGTGLYFQRGRGVEGQASPRVLLRASGFTKKVTLVHVACLLFSYMLGSAPSFLVCRITNRCH